METFYPRLQELFFSFPESGISPIIYKVFKLQRIELFQVLNLFYSLFLRLKLTWYVY